MIDDDNEDFFYIGNNCIKCYIDDYGNIIDSDTGKIVMSVKEDILRNVDAYTILNE